jgi:YidC/Oxa1 family membrane protein insertase
MTTIENELVKLTIANKGGYIVEATLKNSKNSKGFRSVSSTDKR